MKRIAFFFILSCIVNVSYSQKAIPLKEVANHIGDTVKVCGKVYTAYYAYNTENLPTFLNVGAKYPNQLLTVVIWGNVREQFREAPELFFLNKEVCVTGQVILFEGKPQIIINSPSQIRLQTVEKAMEKRKPL